MSTILELAAGEYLKLGLLVIALTGKLPNGKVHQHGIHTALSGAPETEEDWGVIRDAFSHPNTTGIGILTSGPYFVVDIDGEAGAQAWLDIVGEDDFLPETWVVETHHGMHLWFADWGPRKTRRLGERLDLKGEGGYVAAPPSLFGPCSDTPCKRRHMNERGYTWRRDPAFGPMKSPPARLVALLDEQDETLRQRLITKEHRHKVRHEPLEGGMLWASRGFEGLIRTVREAKPGNRNHALYWAAFAMTEDDADEEDFAELQEAALAAGLTERESRLTTRSAQRAAGGE